MDVSGCYRRESATEVEDEYHEVNRLLDRDGVQFECGAVQKKRVNAVLFTDLGRIVRDTYGACCQAEALRVVRHPFPPAC